MYDTIHFWLDRSDVHNVEAAANRLTQAKEIADKQTGEVWTVGNLNNLRATVSMRGVSIKGSLAKYHFPNNTFTLNRHQVKEAVEALSDELCLPMNQARITRIDISTNFIMTHPTPLYFDVLGGCRYYERVLTTKNTLYYQMKGMDCKRTMCFYDKAREVKHSGEVMPEVFVGSNLLRYEARWNKRLPQQFKEPQIIGESLYDERFYLKAVKMWGANYFSIDKKKKIKLDAMNAIRTVKDASDYLCAIALGRLPPEELQYLLDELKANKVFQDPKYYTRLKKRIKEISTNEKLMEADELVKELDAEVKEVLAYIR